MTIVFLLLLAISSQRVFAQNASQTSSNNDTGIYFDPEHILGIREGAPAVVNWYTTLPGASNALITVEDTFVSDVLNKSHDFYSPLSTSRNGEEVTGNGTFVVDTTFIGYNSFNVSIYDQNNNTLGSNAIRNSVLLRYQTVNNIFTYILTILIFIMYINMGATLDLSVIRKIAKKPVGPIVGLSCQYLIMPVTGYALALLFFPDDPVLQLGMFLNGASPGGGGSNIWTFLYGGSLDLSIAMTLTSTVCAFAAVPFWVLTLGPTLFSGTEFQIPFINILYLVLGLVIPCSIGIVIQLKAPKVSTFLSNHVLKPLAIFNAVFIATFGVYANRYLLSLFTPKNLFAAFLLPIIGYTCGFVISYFAKRTKKEIIAIAIETGVQNANIPILILKWSLEKPMGDLSIVVPAAVVILTPFPLLGGFLLKKFVIQKYFGKGKTEDDSKKENKEGADNAAYVHDSGSLPTIKIDDAESYRKHPENGITNISFQHDASKGQDMTIQDLEDNKYQTNNDLGRVNRSANDTDDSGTYRKNF